MNDDGRTLRLGDLGRRDSRDQQQFEQVTQIGRRQAAAHCPCYSTYRSGVTTKSSGSFTPVAWLGQ